jgi:nitrate/TMAO reductase-like tetraheme cytochrome c subunit
MTWRVVGGLAVAALVGVALSAGGRILERSPTFCVSCHEMERPGKGWKASGASEHHPDCIMCHSGPGPFGVLEAQTRGLGMLVEHFVESEEKLKGPFKAKVPDRFCTQCHEPMKIEAPHKKFSTEGKACRDCHKHREDWEFNGELRASGESAGEADASITREKD